MVVSKIRLSVIYGDQFLGIIFLKVQTFRGNYLLLIGFKTQPMFEDEFHLEKVHFRKHLQEFWKNPTEDLGAEYFSLKKVFCKSKHR